MYFRAIVLGAAIFCASDIAAEPLSAIRYVELDLKVLQATLTDAQGRLTLLELGGDFGDEVQESGSASVAIGQLYRAAGTTPVEALRWHARHQPEVKALLEKRPELARQYDETKAQLKAVSSQLQALRTQPHYKD